MSGTDGGGWQAPGHDPAAPTQGFEQRPTLSFAPPPATGPWAGSPAAPAARPLRRHPVAGALAVPLLWVDARRAARRQQ